LQSHFILYYSVRSLMFLFFTFLPSHSFFKELPHFIPEVRADVTSHTVPIIYMSSLSCCNHSCSACFLSSDDCASSAEPWLITLQFIITEILSACMWSPQHAAWHILELRMQ
jgi:hypothetical protein